MTVKETKTQLNKWIALVMAICFMTISLYGCGDKDVEDSKTQAPSSSQTGGTGSYSHTKESEFTSESESDEPSNASSEKDSGKAGTSKKPTGSKATNPSEKSTGSKSTNPSKKPTSKSNSTKSNTSKSTPTNPPTQATTKSNTYYPPQVYTNSAPGTLTLSSSDGAAIVDYSNASSGYAMIRYAGVFSNVRTRFTGPNGVQQTYSFPTDGNYYAIPLTGGSGTYSFDVLGNNGGTSYSVVMTGSFNAPLSYSTVAFSRPNINCNYNSSTSCVQYAATLTRGCDTEIAKIEAIYNYVVKSFSYDHAKASSVANTAYIPNLNAVWSSKKGICYDYASTMAAMLRTQGIPTKVEVGYVKSSYHAWISCYVKGSGWISNIIYFNGNSWKLMDPTFASTGGNNCDWSQKNSYQVKYLY